MAATEVLNDVTYQKRVRLGSSSSGTPKYANVGLGKLSTQRFVTDTAYAFSRLLSPVLEYTPEADLLTRKTQVART